jgi:hypothetical protein
LTHTVYVPVARPELGVPDSTPAAESFMP